MLKNNFLLFCFFVSVLTTSCEFHLMSFKSHNDFKEIENNLSLNAENKNRSIAEEGQNSCRSDLPSNEQIIEEIKKMENQKSPGSKVIQQTLNLGNFSKPEATFLEKYLPYLFIGNKNFSACNNVQCVFEQIYENPISNGREGLLIYYLYLKFGYFVSATRSQIAGFAAPATSPLKDSLFKLQELEAFYFLGHLLPQAFKNLPYIKVIQRFPDNLNYGTYSENTCGLAGGPFDDGFILLKKGCLAFDSKQYLDSDLFKSTTHEFAHRLDYKYTTDYTRFSENSKWLELSGWYKDFVIQNGNAGTYYWKVNNFPRFEKARDDFVTGYARSSPVEDFADSVGNFRTNGDALYRISPEKFDWIAKNVFENQSFRSIDLAENFINGAALKTKEDFSFYLEQCTENNKAFVANIDQNFLEEKSRIYNSDLIRCINNGIYNNLDREINSIKKEKFEGCEYFKKISDHDFKINVLKKFNFEIKNLLNKTPEVEKVLKRLVELDEHLKEDLDPRPIFLECQTFENSTECYTTKLDTEFTKISSSFQEDLAPVLPDHKKKYLQLNSYNSTQDKIVAFFKFVYDGIENKLAKEGSLVWQSCQMINLNGPTRELAELKLSPFNGGSQYIHGNLLQCLNENAEKSIITLLETYSKKLGITISNDSTKRFIYHMYSPFLTSKLSEFVKKEAELENQRINTLMNLFQSSSIANLTSDLNWMGTKLLQNQELFAALNTAIDGELQKFEQNESQVLSNLKFTILSNLYANSTDKIRSEVLVSANVRKKIDQFKEMTWQTETKNLEAIMLENAYRAGRVCNKRISFPDKLRHLCLTNTIAWDSIENSAIAEWLNTDTGKFFNDYKKKASKFLDEKSKIYKEISLKKMDDDKKNDKKNKE